MVVAEELEQLLLRDPGLDGDVGEIFAEIDDAIQPAKIEEDRAIRGGHARAVAPVLPSADRVHGDAVRVGDAEARLYLQPIGGTQNQRNASGGGKGGGLGGAED